MGSIILAYTKKKNTMQLLLIQKSRTKQKYIDF